MDCSSSCLFEDRLVDCLVQSSPSMFDLGSQGVSHAGDPCVLSSIDLATNVPVVMHIGPAISLDKPKRRKRNAPMAFPGQSMHSPRKIPRSKVTATIPDSPTMPSFRKSSTTSGVACSSG